MCFDKKAVTIKNKATREQSQKHMMEKNLLLFNEIKFIS